MSHKVDLYSLSGCPHCKNVKDFFAKNNIAYTNYDLDDENNVNRMVEITGEKVAPAIVIDDGSQIVLGDDLIKLQILLLGEDYVPDTPNPDVKADHELIIIGAGSAALPAALYAGRKELDAIVIAGAVGGMVNQSKTVENYPGIPDVAGNVLMEKLGDHAKAAGAKFVEDVVTGISEKNGVFTVETLNDATYTAKAVLAATGRSPRFSGAKNEMNYLGKGLAVCTTCDGPLYKGKSVAVIGGGNTAFDMAIELAGIAREVHIIVRSSIRADEILQRKVNGFKNVTIHLNTTTEEIYGKDFVEGIVIKKSGKGITKLFKSGTEKLAVEGVFLGTGLEPNTALFANLVELNKDKEIIVDENCCTSKKGFFAAGDSTSIKAKQIASSVGEGVKALLSAYDYLRK